MRKIVVSSKIKIGKGTQNTFVHCVKANVYKGLQRRATFYISIWGRILNDLEYCLEKNSDDIERTLQIEDEMKSYVSNVVDVAFHSPGIREKIFGNKTISAGVEELYKKCYSALEDMK